MATYDLSDHPLLDPIVPAGQLEALTEVAEAILGATDRAAPAPYEVRAKLALVYQVNFLAGQGTTAAVLSSQGKTGANFRSTSGGEVHTVDPRAAVVWRTVPAAYRVERYGEPSAISRRGGSL